MGHHMQLSQHAKQVWVGVNTDCSHSQKQSQSDQITQRWILPSKEKERKETPCGRIPEMTVQRDLL